MSKSNSQKPRATTAAVVVAVAICCGMGLAITFGPDILEQWHLQVHASEKKIATHIRELGGTYYTDRLQGRHISAVWLDDTLADDNDVAMVLGLPHLNSLGLARTKVTNEGMAGILGQKNVRSVDVSGTNISQDCLQDFWKHGVGVIKDDCYGLTHEWRARG